LQPHKIGLNSRLKATPTVLLLFFLVSCASQGQAEKSGGDRKLAGIRLKAENGDADAQCRLGDSYYFGRGLPKDYIEALKWYRKAAEQNSAHAQCCLGIHYFSGEGVAKDEVEALKWWRKAAEQNQAQAQVNLGLCYAHGRGVAKDEVEAINLYRKAGKGGEVYGFNNLAWLLATSENSAIRNGPNAVLLGEKAVAATNRKDPTILDTLAAAYAEATQLEKAVKTEKEAIALLQTEAEKNVFRTRLKLYEAELPYRDKDQPKAAVPITPSS